MKIIDWPYVLVLFSVPVYIDKNDGTRWLNRLWAKDLVAHTAYLRNLNLLTPHRMRQATDNDLVRISDFPELERVRFTALSPGGGVLRTVFDLPINLYRIYCAIGSSAFVHSAVAGWPIPSAWLTLPISKLLGKPHMIIVESAFWRLIPGVSVSVWRKMKAGIFEYLNRYMIRHSELSIFTSEAYMNSLLGQGSTKGHVIEATWVDESDVLSEEALQGKLRSKSAKASRLRIGYYGRLNASKGVDFLVEQCLIAIGNGKNISLDLFGEGPLAEQLEIQCSSKCAGGAIRMRGTVEYGDELWRSMQEFDIIAVPTRTDEQPRIIFDAFSQGVPVLAAATSGNLQCVRNLVTGIFFESDDAKSFAAALDTALSMAKNFPEMPFSCLETALQKSHRRMHEQRSELINEWSPSPVNTSTTVL